MRVNDLFTPRPETPVDYAVEMYERERLRHIVAKLDAMVHRDPRTATERHEAQLLLRRAYIAERDNPVPEGLS